MPIAHSTRSRSQIGNNNTTPHSTTTTTMPKAAPKKKKNKAWGPLRCREVLITVVSLGFISLVIALIAFIIRRLAASSAAEHDQHRGPPPVQEAVFTETVTLTVTSDGEGGKAVVETRTETETRTKARQGMGVCTDPAGAISRCPVANSPYWQNSKGKVRRNEEDWGT
ncbi:unnamed protein product [Zymoseptoria tritici ST99CH_1A5]|uniref:Uncharacterized protein n=1 Tax=Zymoseptoria tritici ST99CH_1A5 TaxID=1276529 RepID=A0A1Y6M1X0_ZYMTR|nr:unnamed protein product [Zymoseptoria tritici ST99CH_1A5]